MDVILNHTDCFRHSTGLCHTTVQVRRTSVGDSAQPPWDLFLKARVVGMLCMKMLIK